MSVTGRASFSTGKAIVPTVNMLDEALSQRLFAERPWRVVAVFCSYCVGATLRKCGCINTGRPVSAPGEVRDLKADCSSRPLRLSFSWSNPTEYPFGIVSYRSRYQCRHPGTGHEVASDDWDSCHHSQCPCLSSQARANQCSACERVCNYPFKRYTFMGDTTYYFNCTCERAVADAPVMPGSMCQVTVQAESKYFQQRGAPTSASCQTPGYTVQIANLSVSCDSQRLSASWAVPEPLEVATKAYYVNIQRKDPDGGQQTTFVNETLSER